MLFGENIFRKNLTESVKKIVLKDYSLLNEGNLETIQKILRTEGDVLTDEDLNGILTALRRNVLKSKFDQMWEHKAKSLHPNVVSRAGPYIFNMLLSESVNFEDKMKWCDYLLKDQHVFTKSNFKVGTFNVDSLLGSKLTSNSFYVATKSRIISWAVNNRTGKAEFFLQLYGKDGANGPAKPEVDVALDGILIEVKALSGAASYYDASGKPPPTGQSNKAWDNFFKEAAELLDKPEILKLVGSTPPGSVAKFMWSSNSWTDTIKECYKKDNKLGFAMWLDLVMKIATGDAKNKNSEIKSYAKEQFKNIGSPEFGKVHLKLILTAYANHNKWDYIAVFKDYETMCVVDKNMNGIENLKPLKSGYWMKTGDRQGADFSAVFEPK